MITCPDIASGFGWMFFAGVFAAMLGMRSLDLASDLFYQWRAHRRWKARQRRKMAVLRG